MDPLFEQAQAEIEPAIAAAGEEALERAPAGKWSAAQIVEHLALSYRGTAQSMRKALERGRPIGHPPTLAQRLSQLVVIDLGYFPRVKAPAATVPSGLAPSAAVDAWRGALTEMDEALAACERAFGARAIVADHPILGGLTAAGWRRFHLQHARHHARQIRDRLAAT